MDTFKTVLHFTKKGAQLGFGASALLTAAGQYFFSNDVFTCPCDKYNFWYGLVFLLVPALALMLLGIIMNKRTWRLLTGRIPNLCRGRHRRRDSSDGTTKKGHSSQETETFCKSSTLVVLVEITFNALLLPYIWIAAALLTGTFSECLVTGFYQSIWYQNQCDDTNGSQETCNLHLYPCGNVSGVTEDARKQYLHNVKALSQITGWLIIAFIILLYILVICVVRLRSRISYLQLKFRAAYTDEERSLFRARITQHAKQLAERNVDSFFSQTQPGDIITPTNHAWEEVSSLFKFIPEDHYYSALHQYVEKENFQKWETYNTEYPLLKQKE